MFFFIWLIMSLFIFLFLVIHYFWDITSSGRFTSFWGVFYIKINSIKIKYHKPKKCIARITKYCRYREIPATCKLLYYGNRILENLGHLVALETVSWRPELKLHNDHCCLQFSAKSSPIFSHFWSYISENRAHMLDYLRKWQSN